MNYSHDDENFSLTRFESMLKTNDILFFDSSEFENIIHLQAKSYSYHFFRMISATGFFILLLIDTLQLVGNCEFTLRLQATN